MSLVLNVEILGEFKKLTAATNGAAKDLKGLNGTVSKISKGMKTALGAIGVGFSLGVVINQLKEASQAAIEDTKSQELLANQLKNSANATETQIKAVEKSIGKMQLQAAVADDQLRPAFAQLTRATGDTAESTKLLDLALDISAGSGKSLEAVTMALTKAYNGQFGALTKLGVPMSDQILNASLATTTQKELNKALAAQQTALELYGISSKEYSKATEKVTEVQDKLNRITADGVDWQGQLKDAFAGSAEAAANTDPYQRMNILFGELQEQVGLALLPYLQQFSQWLAQPGTTDLIQGIVDVIVGLIKNFGELITLVVKYKEALIPIAGIVGTLTTAWKAYNIVNALAVTGTNTLAIAMKSALGPITAVLVALQAIDFVNKQIMANGGWSRTEGQGAVNFSGQSTAPTPSGVVGNMVLGSPTATKPTTTAPTTKPPTTKPTTTKPVVVNNNITVNSASTNATGVVSSLQAYQNQTGATLSKLLK
jgi:hypothetical protein